MLGGKVEKSFEREFGKANLQVIKPSPLINNIKNYQVWMSHGDHISNIPQDFEVIATTPKAPFAMIANDHKKIYGVQFHPEVYHSIDGAKILKNFVINIAGCKSDWSMKDFKIDEAFIYYNFIKNLSSNVFLLQSSYDYDTIMYNLNLNYIN
mgnify:CR=1 FL=1